MKKWIAQTRPITRLAIALLLSLLGLLPQAAWLAPQTRALICWDIGTCAYLVLAWTVITEVDAATVRRRAQAQDLSSYLIFLLVVSAASASAAAIGLMMGVVKDLPSGQRFLHLSLCLLALAASWTLVHTLFAFHYAHTYYNVPDRQRGVGLQFPGEGEQDYLDFAYFSFVVGMTSQVSDVAVTTQTMRRITLIHGVLSFAFNIVILALSINVAAGLL